MYYGANEQGQYFPSQKIHMKYAKNHKNNDELARKDDYG